MTHGNVLDSLQKISRCELPSCRIDKTMLLKGFLKAQKRSQTLLGRCSKLYTTAKEKSCGQESMFVFSLIYVLVGPGSNGTGKNYRF